MIVLADRDNTYIVVVVGGGGGGYDGGVLGACGDIVIVFIVLSSFSFTLSNWKTTVL